MLECVIQCYSCSIVSYACDAQDLRLEDWIRRCRNDNLVSHFPKRLSGEPKQAGTCLCSLSKMGPSHIVGLPVQVQTPKHTWNIVNRTIC